LAFGAVLGAVVGALLAVEIPSTGLGFFFGVFTPAMAARSMGFRSRARARAGKDPNPRR
jgi:uncharacterized membrane protein YfcA